VSAFSHKQDFWASFYLGFQFERFSVSKRRANEKKKKEKKKEPITDTRYEYIARTNKRHKHTRTLLLSCKTEQNVFARTNGTDLFLVLTFARTTKRTVSLTRGVRFSYLSFSFFFRDKRESAIKERELFVIGRDDRFFFSPEEREKWVSKFYLASSQRVSAIFCRLRGVYSSHKPNDRSEKTRLTLNPLSLSPFASIFFVRLLLNK
jgi:hypothetical protein